MHKILINLKQDHVNLNRLLNLLEKLLDDFHVGNEPDFELMDEIVDYIENYADLIHHPTEERLFQALSSHTSAKQKELGELQDQHTIMIKMTRALRHSLEGIMQGTVVLREEVETQGRDYLTLQRRHLVTEDREIFPLLDNTLQAADWQQIVADIPANRDPLFAEPDNNRFRALSVWLEGEGKPRLCQGTLKVTSFPRSAWEGGKRPGKD